VFLEERMKTDTIGAYNSVFFFHHCAETDCIDAARNPVALAIAYRRVHTRGVQQCFSRNAATVEACASQRMLFYHTHLRSQLGSPDGGDISARSAADNDYFFGIHACVFLSS
jgi:hypothetical protein